MLLIVLLCAAVKKVKAYEMFVDGAKEGFLTVWKIAPYLLTMLFAIDIFRASGAMNYVVKVFAPLVKPFGMPEGVLPMFLIKPLSGSGSIGIFTDIITTYGVDSMEGRIAAVMMGSTETIFYTIAVYMGSCNIKNTRHCIPAALIAHVAGCFASVYVCRLFFG